MMIVRLVFRGMVELCGRGKGAEGGISAVIIVLILVF